MCNSGLELLVTTIQVLLSSECVLDWPPVGRFMALGGPGLSPQNSKIEAPENIHSEIQDDDQWLMNGYYNEWLMNG